MNYWVGVTDDAWFAFLSARLPDEVNFWQPGGKTTFKAILPGAPFLFKLHSPRNVIAGGGFFVRQSFLPVSVAWDAFGESNGVPSRQDFQARIRRYRSTAAPPSPDPTIGCLVLTAPFFFLPDARIPVPANWAPNLVTGRSYDTQTEIGADLWEAVRHRLHSGHIHAADSVGPTLAEQARFGEPRLVTPRLGQGAFRVLVTEAYTRRCAITGERTLPVLEAAHIVPYASDGPHAINNGILLRSDLHTLFDRGYLTVTPDFRVAISSRIRAEFANGREYYALDDKPLLITPQSPSDVPTAAFLAWHNRAVFVA